MEHAQDHHFLLARTIDQVKRKTVQFVLPEAAMHQRLSQRMTLDPQDRSFNLIQKFTSKFWFAPLVPLRLRRDALGHLGRNDQSHRDFISRACTRAFTSSQVCTGSFPLK